MSLGLLSKKIILRKERFVSGEEIRGYCGDLHIDYNVAISYLVREGYVKRIVKGFFYVPGVEERKFKRLDVNYLEAVAKAMEHKGIANWYFGFDTALKLNNVTHEYLAVDCVVSDKLFRAKPIVVLSHTIKFVKFKSGLFGFGTKMEDDIIYSDVEKMILDTIYKGRYSGESKTRIKAELSDLLPLASKDRLMDYASRYNGATRKVLGELL